MGEDHGVWNKQVITRPRRNGEEMKMMMDSHAEVVRG